MLTASAPIDELRIPMTPTTPLAGFAELYERHYEAVFRAALRVTGNPATPRTSCRPSSCVSSPGVAMSRM